MASVTATSRSASEGELRSGESCRSASKRCAMFDILRLNHGSSGTLTISSRAESRSRMAPANLRGSGSSSLDIRRNLDNNGMVAQCKLERADIDCCLDGYDSGRWIINRN
jgi:hypothetical protein